jgi:hypothetical protein
MIDYEKEYKSAFEKAKKLKETCDSTAIIGWCEYIFPSLKETEGEKIRKELIDYLKERKSCESYGQYVLRYDRWITWLEKQREQKQVDKIEPKFHEGYWVVTDKGDTVQIGTVNNDYYTIGNGMLFSMPYVDTSWHLWTIEDVKDGDVLCFNDRIIAIFKYLYNNSLFYSYCHCYVGSEGLLVSNDETPDRWGIEGFQPATKTQRDILFARMKEDGYVWNEDKKELIKL